MLSSLRLWIVFPFPSRPKGLVYLLIWWSYFTYQLSNVISRSENLKILISYFLFNITAVITTTSFPFFPQFHLHFPISKKKCHIYPNALEENGASNKPEKASENTTHWIGPSHRLAIREAVGTRDVCWPRHETWRRSLTNEKILLISKSAILVISMDFIRNGGDVQNNVEIISFDLYSLDVEAGEPNNFIDIFIIALVAVN